jgi:drug/metabolite transporter (DMT)-like permease
MRATPSTATSRSLSTADPRQDVAEQTGRVAHDARPVRFSGAALLAVRSMSAPARQPAPAPLDRQPAAAAHPHAATAESAPASLVWLCLGIVYVVWGSTYLAIRVAVETMPPLLMGAARFTTAGLLLYAVGRFRGAPSARTLSRRQIGACWLVGSLLAAGGNGVVNVAEQYIPSSLAALVISSVPLWVVVMRRLTGESVPWVTLASVAVGFCGVALLLLPGGGVHGGRTLGFVLVVCAAFSWALGSFTSRKLPLPPDALLSTSLQMAGGGITMLVAGLALGEAPDVHPSRFSTDSLLAFAYLILIGSLVAYTAYVWLLQNAPISKVATYAYVNPVIAIFLGWSILSERVTTTTLVGATVIVASVAATVRRESG